MTNAATKLRRLELAESSPYFGRIDFLSDGDTEVIKIYVGKTNLNDEKNNQIVTNSITLTYIDCIRLFCLLINCIPQDR